MRAGCGALLWIPKEHYLARSRSSFCTFKFAAQLDWLAVWFNESELHDVLVSVDYGERHTLHQASPGASCDVEKIELARLTIRRHLPFKASPISAITIMRRE